MKRENNSVVLVGVIESTPKFSHSVFRENFYIFSLKVKRISGVCDILPILVSDRMFDVHLLELGDRVHIEGELRSYNQKLTNKNTKLILEIFVMDIYKTEEDDANEAYFQGYLCKAPTHRFTPSGREISDLLIATNRVCGKSDYIPMVAWGRIAKYAKEYQVGDFVQITGRIQSREYTKKIDDQEEIKTAYEVSIFQLTKTPINKAS